MILSLKWRMLLKLDKVDLQKYEYMIHNIGNQKNER